MEAPLLGVPKSIYYKIINSKVLLTLICWKTSKFIDKEGVFTDKFNVCKFMHKYSNQYVLHSSTKNAFFVPTFIKMSFLFSFVLEECNTH